MTDGINCIDCQKCAELKIIEQLRNGGVHVKFGRYPTPVGFLYYHHAIVVNVNKSTEEVTIVEFGADEFHLQSDSGARRREKTLKFKDMRYAYIVMYKNPVYSEEEVIKRARLMLKEDWPKYKFLNNNCEILAMYIMTGVKICYQTEEKREQVQAYSGVCTAKLKDIVEKFVWELKTLYTLIKPGVDKVLQAGTQKLFEICKVLLKCLAKFAVIGLQVAFFLYVCYSTWSEIKKAEKLHENKMLCSECFETRKLMLICRAILGVVSSIMFGLCGICSGVLFSLSALVFDVLFYGVEPLMECLNPVNVPKLPINSWEELSEADAITIQYWGLPHDALVTGIYSTKLVLKIAIFRKDGKSGNAWIEIIDETVALVSKDGNETSIEKYDYKGQRTKPPGEVIDEINKRMDSQENGPFIDHTLRLINEIKMVQTARINTVPPTVRTPLLKLFPGDAVIIHTEGRKRPAIILDYQFNQEEGSAVRCIQCIHYALPSLFATRTLTEELFKIDRRKDMLLRHNYSTDETFSAEETIRIARSRVGEQKFNIFRNRSSHFTKYCKELPLDLKETRGAEKMKNRPQNDIQQNQALEMIFSNDKTATRLFSEELNRFGRQIKLMV